MFVCYVIIDCFQIEVCLLCHDTHPCWYLYTHNSSNPSKRETKTEREHDLKKKILLIFLIGLKGYT
jgi:hypothetical protein